MVAVVNKFNRGEVSPLALARDDVTPVNNSCELMENFLPLRLGPMQFRPGFEYVGDANDPTSAPIRSLGVLTRAIDNTILIESDSASTSGRVWDDGVAQLVENTAPTLTNQDFVSNITGWTAVGSTAWHGAYSGCMQVFNSSGAHQSVTVTSGAAIVYRIEIHEGPCYVRIGDGAAYGLRDLFDAFLFPGTHLVEITPATTQITISFIGVGFDWGDGSPDAMIGSISPVSAGTHKYFDSIVPSGGDFKRLARAASADTMFVAKGGDSEPAIARRIGTGSYSGETYIPLRGPFLPLGSSTTTLSSSGTTGRVTLTASADLFTDEYLNRLVKLVYPSKTQSVNISATGHATSPVAVRGYGANRDVLVEFIATSSFAGLVEIRRYSAVSGSSNYEVVRTFGTTTGSGVATLSDNADGELFYYYGHATSVTGGTATLIITTSSAQCYGTAYITEVNSGTSAVAMVYHAIPYAGVATGYWEIGAWATGLYPQGVSLYEGRVVWASQNRVDLTAADDYYSFETDELSSSNAISRTIGFGPVDSISWVDSANGLFLALPTAIAHIRSSSFEESLTLTNTALRPVRGGVGAKPVRSLSTDDLVYFVSRDGKRLYELSYEVGSRPTILDQMVLHPTICADGIAQIEVTKHPETRIWVLTETGELRVMLKEPSENVQAWARMTVDGVVEAIATLPQTGEDELWAIIRRNGNSRLYRLSTFTDSIPLDFYTHFAAPGTATLTGLSHLEGETVHVWADNQFLANTYTVTSGQITIDSAAYANVYVGKQITAKYKSNKLGQYSAQTVIGERFRVTRTALVMKDYAPTSIKTGRDFTHLHDLPGAVAGPLVTDYDEQMVSFGGTLDTDSRICIQATGPCKIMALAYNVNVPKKTATDG